MNQDIGFSYIYSAKENKEILEIRKKYLPQEESKPDELKIGRIIFLKIKNWRKLL